MNFRITNYINLIHGWVSAIYDYKHLIIGTHVCYFKQVFFNISCERHWILAKTHEQVAGERQNMPIVLTRYFFEILQKKKEQVYNDALLYTKCYGYVMVNWVPNVWTVSYVELTQCSHFRDNGDLWRLTDVIGWVIYKIFIQQTRMIAIFCGMKDGHRINNSFVNIF